MSHTIAYQGEAGAYSHSACRALYPEWEARGFASFEDVFAAVEQGEAARALIPVENSIAGRVAEIHQILAHAELHAIGEHFQPIHHHLLSKQNTPFAAITHVASHMQALAQCRLFLQKHQLTPLPAADTAIAAHEVAQSDHRHIAAIASKDAAALHHLTIQKENIQDAEVNVTRFLILAKDNAFPPFDKKKNFITSLFFSTNNKPAALYHALGGVARATINLTRLEGMVKDASFRQAAFYLDMEIHKDAAAFRQAYADIEQNAAHIRIIGCYEAHPHRRA